MRTLICLAFFTASFCVPMLTLTAADPANEEVVNSTTTVKPPITNIAEEPSLESELTIPTEAISNTIKPVPKYSIVTENFPPYNYIKGDKLTGISTEIIQNILEKTGMTDEVSIKLLPWEEAYNQALNDSNTIIYSLTRIPQREDSFKWVGPIATNYWYLFAKKQDKEESMLEKAVTITNLDQAKDSKYKIGVQKDGAISTYLLDKGFKNLVPEVTNVENAKNLISGKIQLWGASELVASSIMRQIGETPYILEKVFTVRKKDLYIGFNIDVSDEVVQKFQKALDQMKTDGTYDMILNEYYTKLYIDNIKDGGYENVNQQYYAGDK